MEEQHFTIIISLKTEGNDKISETTLEKYIELLLKGSVINTTIYFIEATEN